MQYVHRWDLGDRGKLFMLTEETVPKGTVSLSRGYEGRIKENPKRVIKLLVNAAVTKEAPGEDAVTPHGAPTFPKKASIANIIRNYADSLKEKE